MFCTECGTKLDDNAAFCTNCGHQIPVAAATAAASAVAEVPVVEVPVAEPVATPVAEPVVTPVAEPVATPVSQPMYSEPSNNQSLYAETNSQVTSGTTNGASAGFGYGAAQGAYSTGMNTNPYGDNMNQNIYGGGANQAPYNAQQGSAYAYNGTVQTPPKKKGKGCLIAALIGGGIGLLALIVIIIGIIFLVNVANSGDDTYDDYDTDYTYDYDTDYDTDDDTDDTDDEDTNDDDYDTDDTYGVAEGDVNIYGSWWGTAELVSVSGADGMQEYLEELIGRPLTEDEIAGLNGESAEEEDYWMYIYEDDYEGEWMADLEMGDYFGMQSFYTLDAMTYDQYMNDDYSTACIVLDDNNSFKVEVMEKDKYGEYGADFFDADDYDVEDYEVEDDGAYGFEITGQVKEGPNGPVIEGEFVIMFQYGDMEEPYGMAYKYTLDEFYED